MAIENSGPTRRASSGRLLGTSSVAPAPTSGSRTSTVRIGKSIDYSTPARRNQPSSSTAPIPMPTA